MIAFLNAMKDIIQLLPYLDLYVWLLGGGILCAAAMLLIRIITFGRG